jgi:hypothetical protein
MRIVAALLVLIASSASAQTVTHLPTPNELSSDVGLSVSNADLLSQFTVCAHHRTPSSPAGTPIAQLKFTYGSGYADCSTIEAEVSRRLTVGQNKDQANIGAMAAKLKAK